MCITIPSSAHVRRSRRIPLWGWLTDSPARLLPAGGLLSIAFWLSLFNPMDMDAWAGFNLLFGILPFFLFAQLLLHLPRLLSVTPPGYLRYGLLFFLLLGAQFLFFLSSMQGDGVGLLYLLLLSLSWILQLRLVTNFYGFSYLSGRFCNRILFYALLWAGLIGAVTLVSLSAGWIGNPLWPLLAGILYLLPLMIFLLIALRKS
ncbi:MAG: hypothetical protein KME56_04995 [Candidatus Thiodiazotropha sp. (ex Ctena orbiculata)]|uniref:Uncharacterized protein n=1 Tax=Candidatus Thiodiazotropha taylori TaxID=2792791 RepID=A0A944MA96_9GAMM|nr:hypothetical protein [Candidatus Thiodiazotropha taylori]MBT2989692.1 hypothetical protein [Candidatus Thiodiazotropha taylori]MBT2995968.1 hypothetical protein [Candidatus Thiodiazotropha taylori]MBT2999284.1 hypothetical protein [Candidatus Thiodiazotropha taylori]MBV2105543.1 hypothetical protein [Candidatus Thiodiazotropha taylori]